MALGFLADMPGAPIALRLLLVVCYLALLYHVLGAIDFRAICAEPRPRRVFTELWRRSVCWLQRMLRFAAGRTDTATKKRMNEFRVDQFLKLLRSIMIVFAPITLVAAVSTEMQSYGGDWDLVFRFGIVLATYIASLVFTRGILELTVLRLDIFYAIVSLLMCVRLADPLLVQRQRLYVGIRFATSLVYLDFWKTLPWSLAHSALACLSYRWNRTAFDSYGESDELLFARDEVFVCALMLGICYAVEGWLKHTLRVEILAQRQKRASVRLATYHNDAVFWLSPALRLLGPAPHLANMLFLGHLEDHLDGRCFTDFIASEDDRSRFQEFITWEADPDSMALPSLLSLDLRDSCGRTFPVQVFNASFIDLDNNQGHLIGLTEPTWHANKIERTEVEVEPDADAIVQPEARRNPDVDEIASLGNRSVAASEGTRSTTSLCSRYETFVPFLREEGDHTAVRVLLDGFSAIVVACSAGFTSLTGPLVSGTDLCDLMPNSTDGINFMRWLQDQFNQLKGTDAHGIVPFNLRLAGPVLQPADPVRRRKKKKKAKRLEIHARAYMTKVSEDVFLSDMGVELTQDGIDEEYDMLCIVELIAAQFSQPDQDRRPSSTGPVDPDQIVDVTRCSL